MEVKRITYNETKDWILLKHYAKRMPSISYSFWLFEEWILIWIITYWSPASPSLCKWVCWEEFKSNVLELNRLVINSNSPKNSASFLIWNSLKLLPKDKIIVSYADRWQNHNWYVYQATNFLYTWASKPRTDIDTWNKHSRHYESIIDYSKRKFRSSKHRYIYFLNKKARKYLKYEVLPYPKEESKKYECIDILKNDLKDA